MCNPVLAAGMAASAAGSYINGQQQNASAKRGFDAQEDAYKDEIARQHGYQADAGTQFADALQTFRPGVQGQSLASAQQARNNTVQSNITAPASGTTTPGSAPAMVKGEVARKSAQAMSGARAGGTASANLGGWSDLDFGNNVAIGRAGQRISAIGDAAGGSSRLLPLDMRSAATNSYQPPSPLGDLLQLGGQGASLYGMYGSGGPSFGDLFSSGRPPIPGSMNAVTGMMGRV